ncbi:MAG: HD domain-containing protein [Planctomycetes bacterium]|nr:HD domain-containing protein [Planctomycetota bacterium]
MLFSTRARPGRDAGRWEAAVAHRFIGELRAGDRLEDEVFLVRSKDLRTTTAGGLYVHAVLCDRTGQLVARQWQATDAGFQSIPEGGFLRFKGRVENYKGNLQFIIDAMRPAEAGSFEVADYLPVAKGDPERMFARLTEILGNIKHVDLKALIGEFLADEALMVKFRRAPAAVNMHHAYIGGLLEHTLNLLEVALVVLPRYPKLSRDLVLAGLFLHDIGKAEELCFDTSIGYTDNGQLLGHIVQAAMWIEQKAAAVAARVGRPVPEPVLRTLQHIVLSHHGQYAFGSPKLPAIPEAILVHYLDNLDAKVTMFLSEIENDRDPAGHWTNFNKALETKVYKPDVMGARGG